MKICEEKKKDEIPNGKQSYFQKRVHKNKESTKSVKEFYLQETNIAARIKLSTEGFTGKLIAHNFKRCVALLAPYNNKERTLYAGCSWGYLYSFLPRNTNIYALDLSKKNLNRSKKLRRDSKNICCDLQNISLKKDSFDKFFCLGVSGHIPNLEKALKEIHNTLKPNGVGIINFTNMYGLINLPVTCLKLKVGYYYKYDTCAPIDHSFRYSEAKKIIERSGFKIIQNYGWGISFPYFLGNKFPKVANYITDQMIKITDYFPIKQLSNSIVFKVQK